MKKWYWVTAVAMALGVSGGAAVAAVLINGSGQSCGEFSGTWHFVNNHTGGASAGVLDATFTSGIITGVQPSKVLGSVQQFNVTASGTQGEFVQSRMVRLANDLRWALDMRPRMTYKALSLYVVPRLSC